MRKLTRANYEEFFLDHLEGNLNAMEQIMLQDFLALNPDLKGELEEMQLLFVDDEESKIEKKELKQIPFKTDFSEFSIAKLEGDLKAEEEFAFDQFLNSNLKYKKEYELYEKTQLKADKSIQYPDKESLKKRKKLISLWYSGIGIAASILLIFTIGNQNLFQQNRIDRISHEIEIPRIENLKLESCFAKLEIPTELLLVENNFIVKSKKIEDVGEENEEDITRKQELEQPVSIKSIEIGLLANSSTPTISLKNSKKQCDKSKPSNSGLAKLGMSWKSSKKSSGSILLAVAKLGFDKLEKIAGKKIQVKKNYNSETETSKLSVQTRGMGFSTTIK